MSLPITIVVGLLIVAAGCGRGVDSNPPKKDMPADTTVRKEDDDEKATEKPGAMNQDEKTKEFRAAAEKLEKAAQQFNQIGRAYSQNMMEAALAWRKAGDKARALAAANSAINAGPNDRPPLDACIWHSNIGDVLLYAGAPGRAVEQYELAVKSFPDTANAARAQKKLEEAKAKLGKSK
jgi:tetratricopeptide (TPR) repeat protein